MCIKPPKENDQYKNEQIQISGHIFASILLVMIAKLILTKFTIGDMLLHITLAILSVVFYKIFVNSLVVIQEITETGAFSIEEVIGASLLVSIAISALGEIQIFGLSLTNVLSILIVLILGWKNGVLVGTTAGVTIGVTLGIIAQNEPAIVAVYAISGMLAGFLNRFGRIGVIVGFLIGNGILLFASNGTATDLVVFKEALIASLGLLAIPRWVGINIEELIRSDNMLPEYNKRGLEQNEEAINNIPPKDKVDQLLDKKKEEENCIDMGKQLSLKAASIEHEAMSLSGGNQQKVVIAKWLLANPKVLILDEPTRGVDVGAKSEIHSLMCQFAAKGMAVIMISSELPEVMGMSDRILVYHEGKISGEVKREAILSGEENQETILARAFGQN